MSGTSTARTRWPLQGRCGSDAVDVVGVAPRAGGRSLRIPLLQGSGSGREGQDFADGEFLAGRFR